MIPIHAHKSAGELPENCHIGRNGNIAHFHTCYTYQAFTRHTSRRIAGFYQKYIFGNSAIFLIKPRLGSSYSAYLHCITDMQRLLINSGFWGDAQ